MTCRDVVVVGASAGGVNALINLVAALPHDFPAAVFVVLHIPPYSPSHLPEILTRAGPLEAVHPTDGEEIRPGRIYVAPPDRHLLVEKTRVLVKNGPKENRARPAVDALFRSAAYACSVRGSSASCSRARWTTASRGCGPSSAGAASPSSRRLPTPSSRTCPPTRSRTGGGRSHRSIRRDGRAAHGTRPQTRAEAAEAADPGKTNSWSWRSRSPCTTGPSRWASWRWAS